MTVRPHPPRESAPASKAPEEVTLYVARVRGEEFRLVPVRREVREANPLTALQALADFEGTATEERTLPKGTRVLGLAIRPDGTATADFSREIVGNFPGGSRTEQIMLTSVVKTLIRFPSVRRVEIRVEGKEVDSIGGHIDLSEPLESDSLQQGSV